jgi:hypothetical protein
MAYKICGTQARKKETALVDHKEGIRCCSSHGFNYQTLEVLPRGRLDRDVKAIKITKNRKKAMKSGH